MRLPLVASSILASISFAPAFAQCGLQWSAGTGGGVLLTLANGDVTNGTARFDGTAWVPFGAGVAGGGVIDVAELPNGDLVVVGTFTSAGNQPAPGIARWDGAAWHAVPAPSTGMRPHVVAALPTGEFAVAGIYSPNPSTYTTFVELHSGSGWQVIGTALGTAHLAPFAVPRDLLALPSGELLALGEWVGMLPMGTQYGYNELVIWSGGVWHHVGGIPDPAALLVARDGSIYVAARYGVHRWNGAWTALGGGQFPAALAELPDGSIAAGGDLWSANPFGLQRWNGAWSSLGFGSVGSEIQALAMHRSGRLLVSGVFQAAGGVPAADNAVLTTSCPASATATPVGCVGPGGPLVLAATALPWVGATFRSRASGFVGNALALGLVGLGAQQIPLATLHPSGLPNCDLLTTGDAMLLLLPNAGVVPYEIAIPNVAAFAGVVLHHQFVQLELTGQGAPSSLSSSNPLLLRVGVF